MSMRAWWSRRGGWRVRWKLETKGFGLRSPPISRIDVKSRPQHRPNRHTDLHLPRTPCIHVSSTYILTQMYLGMHACSTHAADAARHASRTHAARLEFTAGRGRYRAATHKAGENLPATGQSCSPAVRDGPARLDQRMDQSARAAAGNRFLSCAAYVATAAIAPQYLDRSLDGRARARWVAQCHPAQSIPGATVTCCGGTAGGLRRRQALRRN